MSVAVLKSCLSEEQKNKIRSELFMQAKGDYFHREDQEPNQFDFYRTNDTHVMLPFDYARDFIRGNPNSGIDHARCDMKFTGQLRPNQVDVDRDVTEQLNQFRTSTVGLYPGFGKTVLATKKVCDLGYLAVVLLHREILCIQWKKAFESNTNCAVWVVGEKDPPPMCQVIICMAQRWEKIDNDIRDQVGVLIVDEAHAFCTRSSVDCLLAFHPRYVIAETATLERDDELHRMIHLICGEHIVTRVRNLPFAVFKVETGLILPREKNYRGELIWHKLVEKSQLNDDRDEIILDIVAKEAQKKENPGLILTFLVKHAMILNDKIKARRITSDVLCGTKQSYTDQQVLVGTLSKLGVGFDQEAVCVDYSGIRFKWIMIVCSMQKYNVIEQSVGRAFRTDNPTVYHFVDNDPTFHSHWEKCERWYKRRKGVLSVLSYNVKDTLEDKQQKWLKEKLANMK